MSRAGHGKRRRTAAVPWCTAEAPAPRPAYYEAAEEYPGLPVRLWCRLYRLMVHRGLLTEDPAIRLARFLADTDTVHGNGVIDDVPAMIAAYSARARVSRQTAYTDLRRLVDRGLLRQLQAPAPREHLEAMRKHHDHRMIARKRRRPVEKLDAERQRLNSGVPEHRGLASESHARQFAPRYEDIMCRNPASRTL